ncbi:Flp pilus assembly complex ATPase component TadA [Brevibacillus humidisoli]|uniref:ATPase, T2SS/T4P/T4SS family n=1 Tax=Brevibacillus humidisoli TaxID=2895522 RepID=UPI001E44ADEC|nr:ATPase, T2SS/T4P/T4SS family [Brevibacillus humidisoli]UFJ41331.1 Flp pilus assembly complex ATPase component TadA [Brevibacillus humidisoli]
MKQFIARNRVDLQQIQSQRVVPETTTGQELSADGTKYEHVKNEIRSFLIESHPTLLKEGVFNKKRKAEIERVVRTYIQVQRIIVKGMMIDELVERIWKDLFSLGPLDGVLEDHSITEIMINGFDEPWVKQDGQNKPADHLIKFDHVKHYETMIQTKILNSCGKQVSEKDPIVDARVGDCRVSIVWQPTSQMKGPILTIRKFPPIVLTPEEFLDKGTASEEMFDFIRLIVEGGCTICMGGPTGSGKTTTFKLMAKFIKKGQRTIVIEDTAEMRLHKLYPYAERYHFVSEECRIFGDDKTDITIQKLIVASLRQTPYRIIIGEIRKSNDLLSAIEASFTGHPVWFTMHGDSAEDLAERMAMLLGFQMTKTDAYALLSKSMNIIIMQKHFETENKRRIFEIAEVVGTDEKGKLVIRKIFEYDWDLKTFLRLHPISERLIQKFRHAEIPRERYERYLSV